MAASIKQKGYQQKYDKKTKMISVKYVKHDMDDYDRFKEYLERTGQSANGFIKELIKDFFASGRSYYGMGGIIVKYFPECYQFDEAELNKILRVALATNECQQIIKNIKGQNGENANQNTVEQGRADKGGANA